MPDNRLPWLVVPNGIGERWARWHIFAVQMAHAELAWSFQVLLDHQQRRVSAVLGLINDRFGNKGGIMDLLLANFAISLTLYLYEYR